MTNNANSERRRGRPKGTTKGAIQEASRGPGRPKGSGGQKASPLKKTHPPKPKRNPLKKTLKKAPKKASPKKLPKKPRKAKKSKLAKAELVEERKESPLQRKSDGWFYKDITEGKLKEPEEENIFQGVCAKGKEIKLMDEVNATRFVKACGLIEGDFRKVLLADRVLVSYYALLVKLKEIGDDKLSEFILELNTMAKKGQIKAITSLEDDEKPEIPGSSFLKKGK